mmetsp:Transcript_26637/g.82060  ORF Transcript_26637/g.82060 Transcript_26637/m.82060 type:complete len:583 (+) Transcript_26637:241-1989(+)
MDVRLGNEEHVQKLPGSEGVIPAGDLQQLPCPPARDDIVAEPQVRIRGRVPPLYLEDLAAQPARRARHPHLGARGPQGVELHEVQRRGQAAQELVAPLAEVRVHQLAGLENVGHHRAAGVLGDSLQDLDVRDGDAEQLGPLEAGLRQAFDRLQAGTVDEPLPHCGFHSPGADACALAGGETEVGAPHGLGEAGLEHALVLAEHDEVHRLPQAIGQQLRAAGPTPVGPGPRRGLGRCGGCSGHGGGNLCRHLCQGLCDLLRHLALGHEQQHPEDQEGPHHRHQPAGAAGAQGLRAAEGGHAGDRGRHRDRPLRFTAVQLHGRRTARRRRFLRLAAAQPVAEAKEQAAGAQGGPSHDEQHPGAEAEVNKHLRHDDARDAHEVAESLKDGAHRALAAREADLAAQLAGAAPRGHGEAHDAHGRHEDAGVQLQLKAEERNQKRSCHEHAGHTQCRLVQGGAVQVPGLDQGAEDGGDPAGYGCPRGQRGTIAVALQEGALHSVEGVAESDVDAKVAVHEPEVPHRQDAGHLGGEGHGRPGHGGAPGRRPAQAERRREAAQRQPELQPQQLREFARQGVGLVELLPHD